jgi:hypothetical protein
MDDYSMLKQHLEQNETPYYTFHPKLERPIKAVYDICLEKPQQIFPTNCWL